MVSQVPGGKPHVLILDEGFASGTLTALGLRDAGCRVTVLGCTGSRGSARSERLEWRLAPSVRDPALPAHLDAVVKRISPDVIYPITEPLHDLLGRMQPPWAQTIFPAVSLSELAMLGDKQWVSERMQSVGVRVPAMRTIEDADSSPVVVKGVRGRGGSTTTIADTADAARDAVARLHARGVEPIIQEFVEGPTFLVGGVFHAGRPLRLYAGEKVAQFPMRTGPAARIVSTSETALMEIALRVFSTLRWTGIASADFIRRPNGEFVLLEVNPRPWGSLGAAAACGVDLFGPLRSLMLGSIPDGHLQFRTGAVFDVFPLYLLSRTSLLSGRSAIAASRDMTRSVMALLRRPGESLHILHRVMRGTLLLAS